MVEFLGGVLLLNKNSQLMQMILIMVMVKKVRGAISTLTKIAVRRKTSRMAVRVPEIRSF